MQNPGIPTVEQAEARIASARKAIVKAVIETKDFGDGKGEQTVQGAGNLSALVQSLAAAEGAARVAHIFANRKTLDAAHRAISEVLVIGADDRWSGRSGDLERSRFEGITEAARQVLNLVAFGDADA